MFILITGSDGPNSFIRKKIGCNLLQLDYDQLAIVATLKIAQVFAHEIIKSL